MTKSVFFTLALLVTLAANVHATVTLQFSTATAKLTNIQNAAGNAAGGLSWGIVVSTTDATFAGGGTAYDGFTFPAAHTPVALTSGLAATDDIFYWGGNVTSASVGGTDGGTNVITTLSNMVYSGAIGAGDRFALLWLDSNSNNGSKYGFLTDASFVLPPDGNTTSFSSIFAGPDPVRLADNTFGAIPEPSRFLLVALGVLGVGLRRRR